MTALGTTRRDPAAAWRHIDFLLVGATLAIAILSPLMVYSASRTSLEAIGAEPTFLVVRHIGFLLAGAAVMVVAASVDYRRVRDFTPVIYAAVCALLLLVLTPLGSEVRGQQSWFQFGPLSLQPAELAKLAVILGLAAYGSTQRGDLDLRRLSVALVVAGIPMGLILLQPEVGMLLMIFVPMVVTILLIAGARPRHLAVLVALGIFGIVGAFQLEVVADYQKERLTAFLDPTGDTQRSSYNLNQSKIAIGAGGLTGAGLFQGSQTNLAFVPEQPTDFIFTVVGEELGFVGAATLLFLYAILVWRVWRAAQLARDFFGTLVCVGVLAMLVFSIFQNVGMTMGIMPITGIPLPLMSYGGTAVLTTFAALGLVLNVHMRRFA